MDAVVDVMVVANKKGTGKQMTVMHFKHLLHKQAEETGIRKERNG
jgi:hypothetical protein